MPLKKYFKGHGEEVMASMKKQYGSEKGEQVFYATANKKKETPPITERGYKRKFRRK